MLAIAGIASDSWAMIMTHIIKLLELELSGQRQQMTRDIFGTGMGQPIMMSAH
jgi:hypothetical protein